MNFDSSSNAPGTAHWFGTTKGREGVVGLYPVAMGVVGAMARPVGRKFAKIHTTNSQFGLPQWHYGL